MSREEAKEKPPERAANEAKSGFGRFGPEGSGGCRSAPVLRKERGRILRFVWMFLLTVMIIPKPSGAMLDNLRTFYEVFMNAL
ncbi:MAG TPA: hypothetical protein IAC21_02255 [Candidatus Enterenecus merdae]|nr:hypothetical protein [Candidatus Enterenecus merdae]